MKKIVLVFLFMFISISTIAVNAQQLREVYYVVTSPGEDMATSVGIHWHSDVEDTFLEYTLASDLNYENKTRVYGDSTLFSIPPVDEFGYKVSGFEERYINSVTLEGLIPGTEYIYRVGKTSFTENYHFKTATPGEFTFIHSTDVHGSFSVWSNLLDKAYEVNPDIAFPFISGDTIDRGGNEGHWPGLFNMPQLRRGVFAFGVGNHEYYAAEDRAPADRHNDNRYFNAFYNNPKNGPELLKNSAYYFRYNNALFVMVDIEIVNKNPAAMAQQKQWLVDVFEDNSDADYIIVGMHRSMYGSIYGSRSPALRQHLQGIFDLYGVDLVFSGHDHVYARTHSVFNDQISENPYRGTTYIIGGTSGTKVYPLTPNPMFEKSIVFDSTSGGCINLITVTEQELIINLIDSNGDIIDNHTIPNKRLSQGTIDENFSKAEFIDSISVRLDKQISGGATIFWDDNFYGHVKHIRLVQGTFSLPVVETLLYHESFTDISFTGIRDQRINTFELQIYFDDGSVEFLEIIIDTRDPHTFIEVMDIMFSNFKASVNRVLRTD